MAFPLFIMAALAAGGVTDNPCPHTAPIPPELVAWRAAIYAPGNKTPMSMPAAAAKAYAASEAEARTTDWANLCRYHSDNARLLALPSSARQVVFMGDSITEGWEYGDPSFYKDGWIDRGISGQTTPQMLLRFPTDVIALHPRVVHIMAGTNDIAGNTGPTTLGTIEGNIAAMVVLAKAAGIRVVLTATPPSAKFTWVPNFEPAPVIAALNARLRRLAVREKVTFVDYAPELATPTGAMRPELTLDGTHPSAAGYALMEPIARKAINPLLEARKSRSPKGTKKPAKSLT